MSYGHRLREMLPRTWPIVSTVGLLSIANVLLFDAQERDWAGGPLTFLLSFGLFRAVFRPTESVPLGWRVAFAVVAVGAIPALLVQGFLFASESIHSRVMLVLFGMLFWSASLLVFVAMGGGLAPKSIRTDHH